MDDWLAVAAMSVTERASLLAVLDVGDPAELESAIVDWTSADLHAALLKVGVPSEPVKRAQRVAFLEDDLNRARRLSVTFDHAAYGRISQIGELWSFGDLPLKLERSAPTLGQHSVEILTQLGYRPHEIEELGRSGVVAGPGLGP
jgi:crotonobetainyl-CoA:carnitine CoA-transferase CaiB-like acyl-CoA transferase